jgi:hypothetical protein
MGTVSTADLLHRCREWWDRQTPRSFTKLALSVAIVVAVGVLVDAPSPFYAIWVPLWTALVLYQIQELKLHFDVGAVAYVDWVRSTRRGRAFAQRVIYAAALLGLLYLLLRSPALIENLRAWGATQVSRVSIASLH